MRKHYLLWMILFLQFSKLNAQTYCTPTTGGTNTTNYLKTAVFSDQGAFYYDATAYQMYVDNSTSHTVTSYPGGTVKVRMDFSTTNTKSLVWVDWNSNGDFNDFYENPLGVSAFSTFEGEFFVPPTQAPGTYRMRVQTGTTLNGTPNPCGPNTNTNGNFVDFSLKIEATPTCFVPTALTAANITTGTATISWTAPSATPGSGYEYYYTSSTVVPDAATTPSGTSTTTSALLTGLTSFTKYYYYVRSICGASDKSAWSLRGSFKTKCDPVTYMFENFENATTGALYELDCWEKIVLGTGYLAVNGTAGVNNSKAMNLNASGTANAVLAILPAFSNVNAGTHWLRFKAKTASSAAGLLDIGYVTNDIDASTFVNIQSVSVGNTAYDGYEYSVVVPNTVPANAKLAIRHNGVPNNSLYIDNVYWEPKATCLPASNVVLSNVTSASVDIAWTASPSAPAMGYDIYYSTSSTPPDASTIPNMTVTSNPYTLPGLNSATTYYIWVRAKCSAADQSSWTNVSSILTLCAPQTSLFENFDAYNTGLITNAPCWGRLVTGIGGVNINGTGAYSGTKHIMQRPLGASSMAVLPELSNINAGTHSLSFRAYCSANTGILRIGYVTNPTDITSFVSIQDVNITNTSYNPTTGTSLYTVAVPNTVPATARLAIYTDSGNLTYYWDDLLWAITGSMGLNEASAKQDIVIYPNPFTDVINISAELQVQSVAVYDASGRMVKEIRSSEKRISLQDLKQGVYMIKLMMKNGASKTIKAVKK